MPPTFPGAALGPLDGRYRAVAARLTDHLSEAALNRERLRIEVEWLIHLAQRRVLPGVRALTGSEIQALHALVTDFGEADVGELAELERETVHDVKAVEYLLKRRLASTTAAELSEIVHFGCTSEDVNNLAYARMVQRAVREVWLPAAHNLVEDLVVLANQYADVSMLARTHGQPATPTTLGKELAVPALRLRRQIDRIEAAEFMGKLNGATGTYAAHVVAVPDADWQEISREFVESLGLTWNPLTTQIEPHDWQAELYADVSRFNRILHNVCTDMWTYISLGYFIQLTSSTTTGSSTMPHKVNPIRFENAEANLEVSNALFGVLQDTLVTSRLQRDLTDSSMQRNIGTAFGHSLLAIDNVTRGLSSLEVDGGALARDLEQAWEVLGEAVQTVMRLYGLPQPYERLKALTRGKRMDAGTIRGFIADLELPVPVRERLLALTPESYVGLAGDLVAHLTKPPTR